MPIAILAQHLQNTWLAYAQPNSITSEITPANEILTAEFISEFGDRFIGAYTSGNLAYNWWAMNDLTTIEVSDGGNIYRLRATVRTITGTVGDVLHTVVLWYIESTYPASPGSAPNTSHPAPAEWFAVEMANEAERLLRHRLAPAALLFLDEIDALEDRPDADLDWALAEMGVMA